MRMMMLVFNETLESEVAKLARASGLDYWTRLDGVSGKGRHSGTHLGTDIWPGRNVVLLAALPEGAVEPLLVGVRRLRDTSGREGIKAFVWALEAMT